MVVIYIFIFLTFINKKNIAFSAYFQLSNLDKCIEILVQSNRFSEAAMFSKTYCPSRIIEMVKLWKEDLTKQHRSIIA